MLSDGALTVEQWLRQHGGRTQEDLLYDQDDKAYVLMGDGQGGQVKVYLDI